MGRPSNVDVDESAKQMVKEAVTRLQTQKFAHLRNITRGDDSVKAHCGCGADTAKKIHALAVKILQEKGYVQFKASMGKQLAFCRASEQEEAREEEEASTYKKFGVYTSSCEVKIKRRERLPHKESSSSKRPKVLPPQRPAKRHRAEKNPFETHEIPESIRKKKEDEKMQEKNRKIAAQKKKDARESSSSGSDSSSESSSSSSSSSRSVAAAAAKATSSTSSGRHAAAPKATKDAEADRSTGSAQAAVGSFLLTAAQVVEAQSLQNLAETPKAEAPAKEVEEETGKSVNEPPEAPAKEVEAESGPVDEPAEAPKKVEAESEKPVDAPSEALAKEVEAESKKSVDETSAPPKKQLSILVENSSRELEAAAMAVPMSKNSKQPLPEVRKAPGRGALSVDPRYDPNSIVQGLHSLADIVDTLEEVD